MAKRGRKRIRKGYFYEDEEQAVIDYINETSDDEKDKIFNKYLYPAFTKMIESIIRRYKLYVPDEEFAQTFNDTISYLLTKISNFKPTILTYEKIGAEIEDNAEPLYIYDFELDNYLNNVTADSPQYLKVENSGEDGDIWYEYYEKVEKHFKAYSYCGTVCKNYLYFKNKQFAKQQEKMTSYDTVSDAFETDNRYADKDDKNLLLATSLIKDSSAEIKSMIENDIESALTYNQIKVGYALCSLLDNWESILSDDGSNKLQKSQVLYYLREQTDMTTKEVRDNMKSYRKAYYTLKKALLENQ